MIFKYHSKIQALGINRCPPISRCQLPHLQTVYRWVFEDILHKNNFIPVLEINPKRIKTPKFLENEQKCTGFALSMHDSLENSLNHYQNMCQAIPNFPQIVGTRIATLERDLTDGTCDLPSSTTFDKGHFDFYESETAAWQSKIINEPLNISNLQDEKNNIR
jgi:hypothetical protein